MHNSREVLVSQAGHPELVKHNVEPPRCHVHPLRGVLESIGCDTDVHCQDIQRHPRCVRYACDAMTSGPSCQSCQDSHRAFGGIFSFSRYLFVLLCICSFSLGPLLECCESVSLRAVIVMLVSLSHSLLSIPSLFLKDCISFLFEVLQFIIA